MYFNIYFRSALFQEQAGCGTRDLTRVLLRFRPTATLAERISPASYFGGKGNSLHYYYIGGGRISPSYHRRWTRKVRIWLKYENVDHILAENWSFAEHHDSHGNSIRIPPVLSFYCYGCFCFGTRAKLSCIYQRSSKSWIPPVMGNR